MLSSETTLKYITYPRLEKRSMMILTLDKQLVRGLHPFSGHATLTFDFLEPKSNFTRVPEDDHLHIIWWP